MAALARRVNEDSLLADQLKLTDRQNKLERAISDFQLKAEMHMAAAFGEDEAVELAPAYNGDDWADEAEDQQAKAHDSGCEHDPIDGHSTGLVVQESGNLRHGHVPS